MGTLIIHWIHQLPWVFVLNLMETLPVFSIWIKVVGQLTQRLLAFPQTAWLARQKKTQKNQLPIIAFTVQKLCHHTCKGWSKENRWVLSHYYLNSCRAILRLSLSLVASVSACSPAHLCHLWSKKQQIQPEPVSASPQSVSKRALPSVNSTHGPHLSNQLWSWCVTSGNTCVPQRDRAACTNSTFQFIEMI